MAIGVHCPQAIVLLQSHISSENLWSLHESTMNDAIVTVAQKCNFCASIFNSLLVLFRLLSSYFELFVLLSLRFCHLQFLGLVSSSFWTFLLALFEFLSSRFFDVLFFGHLSSRFSDFSPRTFFVDSTCRNVCESLITQDHGISRELY